MVPTIDGVGLFAGFVATVIASHAARFALAAWEPHSPNHALVHRPRRLPGGGFAALALGHIAELFMGWEPAGLAAVRWFEEMRKVGKQGISFRVLNSRVTMVATPRDVEHVLLHNGANYEKGAEMYDGVALILGRSSLVSIKDEHVHTVQRRLVSPAFSAAALREAAEHAVNPCIEVAMRGFSASEGAPIAVEPIWDTMTLDIVAKAAFRETNVGGTNVSAQFHELSLATGAAPYAFIPHGTVIKTKAIRTILRCRDEIRRVAMSFVDNVRRRALQAQPDAADDGLSKRKSLVEYMAEAPELTNEMIADHSLTFLFAGHETTSTALSWGCYELATHPEVQQQLADELRDAFALDQLPDLETLRTLRMLDNVVHEILRLHPPVYGLSRRVVADDVLPSGIFIPAGTEINICINGIHTSQEIYGPDAQEFRPDRWDDAALVERVGQGGWFPFLLGKRNCIGKEFAWNELLMSVATLLRRYELRWPEGQSAPVPKVYVTMRSEQPICVSFTPRTI